MSFQKNILASYSAQIVSVCCSFLASILATRMLGQSGQGELALYVNFVLLSTLLLSMGIPSGLVHFIAAAKIRKEKLFSTLIVTLVLGISFLAFTIFILSSTTQLHYILPNVVHMSFLWMLVMFIYLIFLICNSFLGAILQAENRFKNAGYVIILGALCTLSLYALKYYTNACDNITPLKWIILCLMITSGFQFILYLFEVYKTKDNYFQISKIQLQEIKPLLAFAFLAFVTNFIQFLSYRMDIWFVNYFHGKEITGIYALSVSLAQMVWLLPSAIQSVLYTFISTHSDKPLLIQKTIKTTKQIGIYAIVAGIVGYIASIYLVPILFGDAFSESVKGIGILLLGVVPFCTTMAISGYFAGTNQVRINFYSAIIGFIVCLLFDFAFIPTYGFIGAAWASVVSYISTLIYLVVQFRKEQISFGSYSA